MITFAKKAASEASEIAPDPAEVSGPLSDLGTIELVLVSSADKALSRPWFDLMVRHHYLGSGVLCGAQIRYLIRSETQGVVSLGGLPGTQGGTEKPVTVVLWRGIQRLGNLAAMWKALRQDLASRFPPIVPTIRYG